MDTILVKDNQVTPRYIKAMREYFHLTWEDYASALGYDHKAAALYNMIRQPEKYLTPYAQQKILKGIAGLEKKAGHIYFVTSLVHIPKHFRITNKFTKCKGHDAWCTWVDSNEYCSDECKQLFKDKGKK